MKSKRIIGFTLLFVLLFLLIGLNTASASSSDDVIKNLSDSLESSPVSSMDLASSDNIDSNVDLGSSDSFDSGLSNSIESDSEDDISRKRMQTPNLLEMVEKPSIQ